MIVSRRGVDPPLRVSRRRDDPSWTDQTKLENRMMRSIIADDTPMENEECGFLTIV